MKSQVKTIMGKRVGEREREEGGTEERGGMGKYVSLEREVRVGLEGQGLLRFECLLARLRHHLNTKPFTAIPTKNHIRDRFTRHCHEEQHLVHHQQGGGVWKSRCRSNHKFNLVKLEDQRNSERTI